MTGISLPQLLTFGGVFVIVMVVINGFAVGSVDDALITGNISEEIDIKQSDMFFDDSSYYTNGKMKIPVKDYYGNLLYDLFIGERDNDAFEMYVNGSYNGITTLDIAQYKPDESKRLAYATLLFALKMSCPGGASVIQFIRIIDWGYNLQFSDMGTELSDKFPDAKNCQSIINNTEGNIVDDAINWVKNQIKEVIDKGVGHSLLTNDWLISAGFGLFAFTPLNPIKFS